MRRKSQFPRASAYTDNRGVRRWRWRHKGKTVQLGRYYGSDEFIQRYEAAEQSGNIGNSRTRPGSIDALAVEFYQSAKFKRLGQSTKATYRGIIERFRVSTTESGARRGSLLVRDLRQSSIIKIMSKMSDTPAAANNLLRMLRMLMKLALQLEWRDTDPTLGIDKFPEGQGFHTWSDDEIDRYYEHHAQGTAAHTAMTLMLYTGASRADVVALGWGNITAARIQYRRQKMRTRGGLLVDIPIHPILQEVLDQLPKDQFTFLQTRDGRQRSAKAFGNTMRKWCDAAGLPDCTSHGLRKAMARRLAEAGCTPSEIASITGHKSLIEVARYTEAASRSALADAGINKLNGLK